MQSRSDNVDIFSKSSLHSLRPIVRVNNYIIYLGKTVTGSASRGGHSLCRIVTLRNGRPGIKNRALAVQTPEVSEEISSLPAGVETQEYQRALALHDRNRALVHYAQMSECLAAILVPVSLRGLGLSSG